MFKGSNLFVKSLEEGIAELRFERADGSINKLDRATIEEMGLACDVIAAAQDIRGLLITSGKETFIAGADINEFKPMFQLSEPELTAAVLHGCRIVRRFERLPIPKVALIQGYAFGGGLELALSATYRVITKESQVGLPEVSLGLYPGLGGTVRLPRIAGATVAAEWITSGRRVDADEALAARVVDEVCSAAELRDTGLRLLRRAIAEPADWQAREQRKSGPVACDTNELEQAFRPIKAQLARRSKHEPAALKAVEVMERAVHCDFAAAQQLEAEGFAGIAKTQAAASLIQTFLNEQRLKKLFRQHSANGRSVQRAAVVGAGIMGGGIAWANALRGIPVLMKDICAAQLEAGMTEAHKQAAKLVRSGRNTPTQADAILKRITPQLDYQGFENIDLVIEAVVESGRVKHAVLAELESQVREDTVIASNTSSLRIADLAGALARPANFVGMHFFNPVPVMPLVEVVKGPATEARVVSTAVAYGVALGKSPIVVNDCPGFLVNRILTPYTRAFVQLVADGADFVHVDRVMEEFGWRMGPAYLEDVIGIDTGAHVCEVISAGYPDRMPHLQDNALALMAKLGRYGQKNGVGFYRYVPDPKGKPRKEIADDSHSLLSSIQRCGTQEFSDRTIVERMMLPMIVEAAHVLEDAIVASPEELDMALLLGIGLPRHLGGALKYADWLGLDEVVRMSDRYAPLGPQYRATSSMRAMAVRGVKYYG